MLKIKDNINLKELERFGFNFVENFWLGQVPDNYYHYDSDRIIKINIEENSRCINIIGNGGYNCDPDCVDVLFDLIQAGLVEKVRSE